MYIARFWDRLAEIVHICTRMDQRARYAGPAEAEEARKICSCLWRKVHLCDFAQLLFTLTCNSIAGILVARVLADHFDRVILVDPELNDIGKPKTRIMQYNAAHSEASS